MFSGAEFHLGKSKDSWRWRWAWLHNSTNVLHATELCAPENGSSAQFPYLCCWRGRDFLHSSVCLLGPCRSEWRRTGPSPRVPHIQQHSAQHLGAENLGSRSPARGGAVVQRSSQTTRASRAASCRRHRQGGAARCALQTLVTSGTAGPWQAGLQGLSCVCCRLVPSAQ